MFNDGLKVQQAEERAQQAIKKAERKKQQAAAELKKAQGDSSLSPEEKSEAEAAYRAAVDEFNRIRSGEPVPDEAEGDAGGDDSAEAASVDAEAPTDDASAGAAPQDGPSDEAQSEASAESDSAS
jgi:hypothetical protein